MKKSSVYLFLFIFLTGCAGELPLVDCKISTLDIVAKIDGRQLMDELAVGLCPPTYEESKYGQKKQNVVIIPDFVDINSLQPERIGVVLGEVFRASIFNKCKTPIRQVELARDFKLNSNGLMALSRNKEEVRQPAFDASTAILGTYDINRNKLTIIARTVDIESSTYLAISSKEVSWICQDPVFGRAKIVFVSK